MLCFVFETQNKFRKMKLLLLPWFHKTSAVNYRGVLRSFTCVSQPCHMCEQQFSRSFITRKVEIWEMVEFKRKRKQGLIVFLAPVIWCNFGFSPCKKKFRFHP